MCIWGVVWEDKIGSDNLSSVKLVWRDRVANFTVKCSPGD